MCARLGKFARVLWTGALVLQMWATSLWMCWSIFRYFLVRDVKKKEFGFTPWPPWPAIIKLLMACQWVWTRAGAVHLHMQPTVPHCVQRCWLQGECSRPSSTARPHQAGRPGEDRPSFHHQCLHAQWDDVARPTDWAPDIDCEAADRRDQWDVDIRDASGPPSTMDARRAVGGVLGARWEARSSTARSLPWVASGPWGDLASSNQEAQEGHGRRQPCHHGA